MNVIFEILVYFLMYSMIGWTVESIYRSICEKKIINSGFLNGPYCPIYGIGAIVIVYTINRFPIIKENLLILFIGSMIIFTIWELLVGVLLEKIFKTKYWDYSHCRFNIKGRICLTNSIYWGILGILVIRFIHPFAQNILKIIKLETGNIFYIFVYILTVVFIIDTISSIAKIKNVKNLIIKIEDLNAEIKQKMYQINNSRKQKIDFEELSNNMEKLIIRRNKMLLGAYNNFIRLKTAFPAIDIKEIAEILNMKVGLARQEVEKRYIAIKRKTEELKNKK